MPAAAATDHAKQDENGLVKARRRRTVRGILATTLALAATVAFYCAFIAHGFDVNRETISLISKYDGTQGASVEMDQYDTYYKIAKGGVMHTCHGIPMEDLRQFKPIHCSDGTVISKEDPPAEGAKK